MDEEVKAEQVEGGSTTIAIPQDEDALYLSPVT